ASRASIATTTAGGRGSSARACKRRRRLSIQAYKTRDRGARFGVAAAPARRGARRASALADALARACGQPRAGAPEQARAGPAGGGVALLTHDVERPVLDLVVDAPDVLADHAERDQLDAAEQQDRDRQRAEA